MVKPTEWLPQARDDAVEAALWYAGQGGLDLGEAFLAEVDDCLSRIVTFPLMGSAKHAYLFPHLPVALRFMPVKRFQRYLLYYLDLPEAVRVVRVYNASRGLMALVEASDFPANTALHEPSAERANRLG